jgi:tellurite resistance protein TerC
VGAAIAWSAAWLVLGLLPTVLFAAYGRSGEAGAYAAVYLIERALSIDNVFVFIVLIAAFEIPTEEHERLVASGSIFAFVVRVPAILVGVALFEAAHLVSYILGALLLVLAWQTARGGGETAHSGGRALEWLRRRVRVSEHVARRWVVRREGRRALTPAALCLLALVLADLAFALDSIPAGLAISHRPVLLLSANLLALLGLRPLYQVVLLARERLRYMDQTIALLLALAALKLLLGDVVEVGPIASVLVVSAAFVLGVALSIWATRKRASAR